MTCRHFKTNGGMESAPHAAHHNSVFHNAGAFKRRPAGGKICG
jgi:hypothetical protein